MPKRSKDDASRDVKEIQITVPESMVGHFIGSLRDNFPDTLKGLTWDVIDEGGMKIKH
jgi:hypothetical protein